MRKQLCVLLALLLLLPCAAPGEETLPDFAQITGLDKARELLRGGVTIERIYYTDGYGFSTSEFATADESAIALLWQAVNEITVAGRTWEGVTDWYPQIVFFFSDESRLNICFDAHWLEIGMDHYILENDQNFWDLTAAMTAAYAQDPSAFAPDGEEPYEEPYFSSVAVKVDDAAVFPEELEEVMRRRLFLAALEVTARGFAYDTVDRDNIIDMLDKTLFDLEFDAVLRNQAEKLGLDDFTDAEYDQMWNEAEEAWRAVYAQMYGENALAFLPAGDYEMIEGDDEGNVVRYLASFGVTEESFFDEMYLERLDAKLQDSVTRSMENASEDEKTSFYIDWLSDRFDEADIHEYGTAVAEVCFRLIP